MKKNIIRILKGLLCQLHKLINTSPQKRLHLAYFISNYCQKNLEKYNLSMEIEELFIQCLDLDHWGDKELPPTLSIKEIRESFIPEIQRMIRKLELA